VSVGTEMQNTSYTPETLLDIARRHTAAARAEALLNDRTGPRPVWIRAPKAGAETYTGLTRSYIYQIASQGLIRTVSIREPGKERGCRLFHLQSILEFISRHELGAQQGAK
jgi:hypothetical protein